MEPDGIAEVQVSDACISNVLLTAFVVVSLLLGITVAGPEPSGAYSG